MFGGRSRRSDGAILHAKLLRSDTIGSGESKRGPSNQNAALALSDPTLVPLPPRLPGILATSYSFRQRRFRMNP